MLEINPRSAVDYLKRVGMVPGDAQPTARSLGGGISNQVIMVAWTGGCFVVKQPREKLNVEMDWPADLRRIHIEADGLRTYRRLMVESDLDWASAPTVHHEDFEEHIIAMECIPSEKTGMWKTELLEGDVDLKVAERLGILLGKVQSLASKDPHVSSRFSFKEHFDELRIDPYHRTAASRNPDVSNIILKEADRVYSEEITIVHGDYSPKSVLVNRSGLGAQLWLFDMEVAHWGDPSFDTGFMLNHLFIKSVHMSERREEFIESAMRFWESYDRCVDWDIEIETVCELGCLMLARVDGKSPIEYLNSSEEAQTLRRISKRSLKEGLKSLQDFAHIVREEVNQ
jgi:5-methylthioribose kinase